MNYIKILTLLLIFSLIGGHFSNLLADVKPAKTFTSNMECQVYLAENTEEEIANANYPKIRLFSVPKKVSQFSVQDIEKGLPANPSRTDGEISYTFN